MAQQVLNSFFFHAHIQQTSNHGERDHPLQATNDMQVILCSNGRQEQKAMRERPVRLLLGLKKGDHAIEDLLAEIVVDDGAIPALSQNLVPVPTAYLSSLRGQSYAN